MLRRSILQFLLVLTCVLTELNTRLYAQNLPKAADYLKVELIAKEPLVRNPCAMAFDHKGRLFIGMGPQYRSPTPETPGDSVFLLSDTDSDGQFDSRKQFATGFNSIQGIAWHGNDLWIANAPELTIVRDTDGDDIADEYILLYTDLGNLEHGLHGLTWGPDGRMYMSKGNSKGHTRPGHVAPLPFRELWGVTAPEGSPDFPMPGTYTRDTYKHSYHDPADDWGREGGVLVCDDMGENLEIVSRGFRNPWDIAFDDSFTFQGTDNDQNEGDRVFNPFFGSHYGWGHPWSAHWTGQEHLPTPPITGKVFHGSGTGITYCNSPALPEQYQGIWIFNDWFRRTTFYYHPKWSGAHLTPDTDDWVELVAGQDTLYKPTDIEVAPDGSIYILGWGTEYGLQADDQGNQINEGRIFRISAVTPTGAQPVPPIDTEINKYSVAELIKCFNSPINAVRVYAQEELIQRGPANLPVLHKTLRAGGLTMAEETWLVWAIGRISVDDADGMVSAIISDGNLSLNKRIQAVRVLSHQWRGNDAPRTIHKAIIFAADSDEPRIRFEAIQFCMRNPAVESDQILLNVLSNEMDDIVYYAAWQALRRTHSVEGKIKLLSHPNGGVRCGAFLALAEDRQLTGIQIREFLADEDERVSEVAVLWLAKGTGNPLIRVDPPGGEFTAKIRVEVHPGLKPADIRFTLDGSEPSAKSPRWPGTLVLSDTTTLKAVILVNDKPVGNIAEHLFRKLSAEEQASRSGITAVRAKSGRAYTIRDNGMVLGAQVYTDRQYTFTSIPDGIKGSLLIQTPNEDADEVGDGVLQIDTVIPTTIYLAMDNRVNHPRWLKEHKVFRLSEEMLDTTDTGFNVYIGKFDAGRIMLGGNRDDKTVGGRSNYIIGILPGSLPQLQNATKIESAKVLVPHGDVARGKALFFATGGAGCAKCHRLEESPTAVGFGPNLDALRKQQDPLHIIRSILTPSAEVKEGFAMQYIVTVDGDVVTGILMNESGTAVLLAQPNGTTKTVKVDDIDVRATQKISPMPAFDKTLTPQQVADLVAFLLD